MAVERDDAARAAEMSKRFSFVRSGTTMDEDEALHNLFPSMRKSQTVLQGTNLRDKILRAFQEDFIPYDPSAPLHSGIKPSDTADGPTPNKVVPRQLSPGDVDATPIPSPHPINEPAGILAKNQLIQSWTKRYRSDNGRPPVRAHGDPENGLNPSQTRAIAMMLSERLSLVQGVSVF